MTQEFPTPQLAESPRVWGLTLRQADFRIGCGFLAGNTAILANGGFTSSGWEIATGIFWFSNSVVMMRWPGKPAATKYMGITTALGAACYAVSALHKDHSLSQVIIGGATFVRGGILFLDNKKETAKATVRFFRAHRKEIFAYSGVVLRMLMINSAFRNKELATAIAAVTFLFADANMVISSKAEKKEIALAKLRQNEQIR
jgi:hypothetical protein